MSNKMDGQKATNNLKRLAEQFKVLDICNIVLDDSRFPKWSGSSVQRQHHYGLGGLATHVEDVANLCILNNAYFNSFGKGCNDKDLFLAAIFHDAGKMWDYLPKKEYTEWYSSPHKRNIHHICKSTIVWHDAAIKFNISEERHDIILHAILSHHGQREWGSPVGPNSRLAYILHYCDSLSARVDDVMKQDLFSGGR